MLEWPDGGVRVSLELSKNLVFMACSSRKYCKLVNIMISLRTCKWGLKMAHVLCHVRCINPLQTLRYNPRRILDLVTMIYDCMQVKFRLSGHPVWQNGVVIGVKISTSGFTNTSTIPRIFRTSAKLIKQTLGLGINSHLQNLPSPSWWRTMLTSKHY